MSSILALKEKILAELIERREKARQEFSDCEKRILVLKQEVSELRVEGIVDDENSIFVLPAKVIVESFTFRSHTKKYFRENFKYLMPDFAKPSPHNKLQILVSTADNKEEAKLELARIIPFLIPGNVTFKTKQGTVESISGKFVRLLGKNYYQPYMVITDKECFLFSRNWNQFTEIVRKDSWQELVDFAQEQS